MKLGNSGGGNRGKKYFLRRDIEGMEPSSENRSKADNYNKWFCKNRDSLIRAIKAKNTYNEDTFSETYLRISEKILFTGLEMQDARAYFHRAYYTNYIQIKTVENRYVGSELKEYSLISDNSDEYLDIMRKKEDLYNEIVAFVHNNFPDDYEKFRMNTEDGMTLVEIAEKVGLKAYVVQKKLSAIKRAVKNKFGEKIPKVSGRKIARTKRADRIDDVSLEEFSNNCTPTTVIKTGKKEDVAPEKTHTIKPSPVSESDIILRLIEEKKVVPYSMYQELINRQVELLSTIERFKDTVQTFF